MLTVNAALLPYACCKGKEYESETVVCPQYKAIVLLSRVIPPPRARRVSTYQQEANTVDILAKLGAKIVPVIWAEHMIHLRTRSD